jgi:hypothetical protein
MPQREPHDARPARILAVSPFADRAQVSRCLRVEFEDVGRSVDAVDVIGLRAWRGARSKLGRLAARIDITRARARSLLEAAPLGLSGPKAYELLVAFVPTLNELFALAPLSGLLARAETTACCIDELYARQIFEDRGALALLRRFDLVFVSCEGTCEELEKAVGRPCVFLPPSTDALAACPYPNPAERVVDFYAMGRRPPPTHAALLARAERLGWFYLYDTMGDGRVADPRAHRRALMSTLRRSRYFLVNVAQFDRPDRTGAQQELGYRYFEGMAAGALLVGRMPESPSARVLLDWPDAVIELPSSAGGVDEVLDALEGDPERVERARRANVVNALRRHDHVYRWSAILSHAGMRPMPALEARRRALSSLADQIERPPMAPPSGDRALRRTRQDVTSRTAPE